MHLSTIALIVAACALVIFVAALLKAGSNRHDE